MCEKQQEYCIRGLLVLVTFILQRGVAIFAARQRTGIAVEYSFNTWV